MHVIDFVVNNSSMHMCNNNNKNPHFKIQLKTNA